MSKATCKKAEARQGKIYVGKLPVDEISNQDLSDHFSQVDQFLLWSNSFWFVVFKFGSVVEVIRPVDKLRDDAPKNFCFITFDKEEPARQLVFKGTTSLKGHQLVVSRVKSETFAN